MGLAKTKALLLMMAVIIEVSLGGVYKVGDSAGWTVTANASYYHNWASNNNFHVGDIIVFEYNNQFANLKQVSHQDFESCNATSPIAAYDSGSDSITLKRSGHYYFLCGYRGHCQAGQKVDIMVIPGPAFVIRRLGSPDASSSVTTNGAATSTSTPSSTPSTLIPTTQPLYTHCAPSQDHHNIKVMFKLIIADTVLIALIFLGCGCHQVRVSIE